MNGMYFKSILISDIQKHTARFQSFTEGYNVVTSEENHVGKSSLLKSLYYAMGAEVEYDTVWDKNTKIYIVNICVNGRDYTVARFQKNFAVFDSKNIVLLTKSVSRELAKKYEEIFSFSVYLPNKKTKKIEMAPPAFSFMPYYIDQDTGWTGLYKSFASIDQYEKKDREKSLYYHLNIYNKNTVELLAERDKLKDEIEELKKKQERIKITIEALSQEVKNLVPAETLDELEQNLQIPKEKIAILVTQIGDVRNKIQALETVMQQHEHQLDIIKEYHKIKNTSKVEEYKGIHECPKCGYTFDEEIYDMVRSNYNSSNEEYMCQQIQLIINSIKEEVDTYKEKYVALMNELEEQERAFDDTQDSYDVYIKQRGIQASMRNFTTQLNENVLGQTEREDAIKDINKQLKKLPNKKEIEEKYIEYVRNNIIQLDAWNSAYEGKIKLIKPIKAQGTLENKIILAQFIGLFQTMDFFDSKANRFPFVVDSPRAKEASHTSSRDILKQILELKALPQVILATMDFEDFEEDIQKKVQIIKLSEKKSLLNEAMYEEYKEYIVEMYDLLSNIK